MARKENNMGDANEEVTVVIKKKVSVEVVDGGLFFVSYPDDDGITQRKAATTAGTLFKTLGEVLGLEKKQRKRKPRDWLPVRNASQTEATPSPHCLTCCPPGG